MAKSLIMTFKPSRKGGTVIEADGFTGPGCAKAIDEFVESMGGTLSGREQKLEYLQTENQKEGEYE